MHTDNGEEVMARSWSLPWAAFRPATFRNSRAWETFKSKWYRTSRYPHAGVDFTGQRVAVVGTGAPAVVDDFIVNFMYGYFRVMDPNNLLCMAWKGQRSDVKRHTGGDLRAALGRIKAKTFVLPMSSDMFFPPADCRAEWRLIPDAEFRPIQTIDGHLALFGADPNAIAQFDKHLGELLAAKI
jgi:homoserine acetyltransferase